MERENQETLTSEEYDDDEEVSDLPLFHAVESLPLPRPFVKWAGGKRNLLNEICSRLPKEFQNYFEPFVGGGAVFFALYPQLYHATLFDSNIELIITYRVIQESPAQLIEMLKTHANNHSKKYYYEIRSYSLQGEVEMAARFLYLNKTCYNGLYRVNKNGDFNTPIGSYKNPAIVHEKNLWACHHALEKVDIRYGDFIKISPQAGDFVYFDPPYHPTSDISFTEYTKQNFTEQDQLRLRDFIIKLHKSGVFIMLSNSKTPFIEKAYNMKYFHQVTVRAPRYVNCKPNKRGAVDELLITNF